MRGARFLPKPLARLCVRSYTGGMKNTRPKFDYYKTFSLESDGDFVMCVGRDENSIDALMYEANRLAGLGHAVEVRPCL